MRKHGKFLGGVVGALLLLSGLGAGLCAAGKTNSAPGAPTLAPGHVLVLTGTGSWWPHGGKPRPLRRNVAQAIEAGDQIRCGPGSRLRVRLGGRPFVLDDPEGWWPVPAQSAQGDALGLYLPTLGRARGPAIILQTPVSPAAFVVAWSPDPGGKPLSLRLFAPNRKILWQQDGVDAGTGCLFSPEARRALTNYQAGGGGGQMILLFLREGKSFQQIRFTLRPPEAPMLTP